MPFTPGPWEVSPKCGGTVIAQSPEGLHAEVGDLSSETSPHSFIRCMADVLLCIKQAVEDAEAAIAKAEGK